MAEASLRFYAELNDFLHPRQSQRELACSFAEGTAVKDLIERHGVPHTEVDLVLVNGGSVDFACRVADGDRISVFPVFESLDIGEVTRVRPFPLRQVKFVVDTHVGKLAAYLRLIGFDSLYRNDYDDETLAAISVGERRIILTRDRGLLKRSHVDHGYCVRADRPAEQLKEVVARFQLAALAEPFSRCLRCNGRLEPVARERLPAPVPPRVLRSYADFRACRQCGKVYWQGTHYERLAGLVREVLRLPAAGTR